MLRFPDIKPYIVKLGPLEVRWYGMMYLIGFIFSYILVRREVKRRDIDLSLAALEGLYFHIILGLIVGARLGYVVFYNLRFYINNPLDILAVWHGGMSFHGGLIGTIIAAFLFAKKNGLTFLFLSDLVIPTAPIGLFFGRMGNFINGELYGRATNVPWGMVFPAGGSAPRHPSQLYEAFLEGIVLFAILWTVRDRVRREGAVTATFLILYGAMRFFVEFFREPDAQLGFVLGPFSMGQLLCAAMIAAGACLLALPAKRS